MAGGPRARGSRQASQRAAGADLPAPRPPRDAARLSSAPRAPRYRLAAPSAGYRGAFAPAQAKLDLAVRCRAALSQQPGAGADAVRQQLLAGAGLGGSSAATYSPQQLQAQAGFLAGQMASLHQAGAFDRTDGSSPPFLDWLRQAAAQTDGPAAKRQRLNEAGGATAAGSGGGGADGSGALLPSDAGGRPADQTRTKPPASEQRCQCSAVGPATRHTRRGRGLRAARAARPVSLALWPDTHTHTPWPAALNSPGTRAPPARAAARQARGPSS